MYSLPNGLMEGLAGRRRGRRQARDQHDAVAPEPGSRLVSSALAFATHCHSGQRRDSDGAPFIEHPLEVARLLRDACCSEVVVAAGLLHDVIEETGVGLHELTARFGAAVANLVLAVTDHECVASYRPRKQALREQVLGAGEEAALLFAADKISKVRELADQVRRDRARFASSAGALRARNRLERYEDMRLEHYQECLAMLERVAPRHELVKRLASELDDWPTDERRGAVDIRSLRGSAATP